MSRLLELLKMSTKSTIIAHQGWADLISCNGIYNRYAQNVEELLIFVLDEPRKIMMEKMLQHRQNIKIEVPAFRHHPCCGETCLICHTYGGHRCPRTGGFCSYVDYSQYQDYNHLKVGGFKHYSQWESHVNRNRGNGLSFAHSFYTFENFPVEDRIDYFSINQIEAAENNKYTNLVSQIGEKYNVIHDDPIRGYHLNSLFNRNTPYCNLNLQSDNMIDQIKIIENAKELHFIDSNYSVLIYYLSFTNNKIKNIPKFLHASSRPSDRDISIYTNPTPQNWTVI